MTKVPNLRFPGFQDQWQKKKLGEVADIFDGTHQTPKYVARGVKFVSVENINALDATNKYITEAAFQKEYKIKPKKGDILMTRITAGIIGATAIVENNDPLAYYVSLALIRIKGETTPEFLVQRMASNQFKRELHKRIIHVAFPKKINLGDIQECEVHFPSISEQEKIASFLGLLDNRINTQSKIIKDLKLLKNTICEGIFSQQIRFKNAQGNYFNYWIEHKLDDIGKTYNGLSGKSKENFGSGEKYIQYKQIFDSSRIQLDKCDLVEISKEEKQNKVQYGDIFFTISSETPEEIGMSSVLLTRVEATYLNSFCFGFRPNSFDILDPIFSRYYFRCRVFRDEIVKLAQGSTRYNLSKSAFVKLKILLPNIEEQKFIGNFLTSLDEKIEIEEKLLDQYERLKTFFLDNLFI